MRRSSEIAIEVPARLASGPVASRSIACEPRPRRPQPDVEAFAAERADLLDRMNRLRAILPGFAREADRARTQAARLRVENRRLLEQVRSLQERIEHDSVASRN